MKPAGDSLARFEDAFVAALYGRATDDARVNACTAQAAFGIYRNTVLKGSVDALAANFPGVARLVGDAWFRAAAAIYARASPPDDVRLLHYGRTFPAFLARFEPARELPYLADVARLDLLWIEAHAAPDGTHADPASIAALPAERLETMTLRPHASARWAWFDGQPAYTIWRVNREGVDVPADLAWGSEGALLVRRNGEVIWRWLSAAGHAFLQACATGAPFEAAAQSALNAQPDADLGALFSMLLEAGAMAEQDGARTAGP
ncbi:putative DNA-binding protein [Paraburkholderia caballeronis]|uniref:HvfC/BufC N-terminal domain-containing protein n=1 Tax=Paraburkholderia caballeronis TaxID=416943 RepID=UPI0010651E27|nr:DNA-binding domain-containing protein [Paraburkholderia caballeronis]TDV23307.1 putative DNA-binding protein [Paraburkholderia caballeronis]